MADRPDFDPHVGDDERLALVVVAGTMRCRGGLRESHPPRHCRCRELAALLLEARAAGMNEGRFMVARGNRGIKDRAAQLRRAARLVVRHG